MSSIHISNRCGLLWHRFAHIPWKTLNKSFSKAAPSPPIVITDYIYFPSSRFLSQSYANSTVAFGNHVWVSQRASLNPEFKEKVENAGVMVDALDFGAAGAVDAVNAWVNDLTRLNFSIPKNYILCGASL